MKATIEIVEPKLFDATVADEIVTSLAEAIDERGRASLVLSGGKTPSGIYRTLARPPRVSEISWDNVNIYWGDERWVPQDHSHSNYNLAQETLLSQLGPKGPGVYPVNTSLGSPEEGAEDYANTIRANKGLEGSTLPVFDVVLLGIGEDGHIASLFPNGPLIEKRAELSHAAESSNGNPRVTLGLDSLMSAHHILFIVKGEAKAAVVQAVLEGADDIKTVPARAFELGEDRVTWFLDSAAAQKLSSTS